MRTTLGRLRSFILSEMPLMSVQEPGAVVRNKRTQRNIDVSKKGGYRAPDDDKRQVQKFFKSKKFTDDAVRLYKNLSVPVYVVPAWSYDDARDQRPVDLKDANQLQYYGVSPDRCAELERARKGGAAIFVVAAAELSKGNLPSPWMLVHAMLDSRGGGPMQKFVSSVTRILDAIEQRLSTNLDLDHTKRAYALADYLVPLLTMKSARDGNLVTRDDVAAEIVTQAVLTSKGFTHEESAADPRLNDELGQLAAAVTGAKRGFEQAVAGRVIEIDAFLLQ